MPENQPNKIDQAKDLIKTANIVGATSFALDILVKDAARGGSVIARLNRAVFVASATVAACGLVNKHVDLAVDEIVKRYKEVVADGDE